MNSNIRQILIVLIFGIFLVKGNGVLADWWERPTARPTQPNYERELPTSVPTQTQSPTTQPTATPRIGEPTGAQTPTSTPAPTGTSSSSDDPCAPGKSYTGPYCGWSPRVGEEGGGGGVSQSERIGAPEVMGLS
jgi:hypothetical protein